MPEEGIRSHGRSIAVLIIVLFALLATAPAEAAAAKTKLSVADVTVSESGATAAVEFSLSKKSERKVKAGFTTADGSAVAGADYEAVAGSIRIRPRRKRASAEIPLISDVTDENLEAFEVEITDVSRAKVGDGLADVAITDDDPPPRLSIPSTSISEGDSPTQAESLEVILSPPSAKPVEVDYALAAGTAGGGTDFTPASGRLVIPPGDATATIPATIAGNTRDENDESFTVQLARPVNATIEDGSASITIVDDDPAPVVSITTSSVAEGTSGTYAREITAALSEASDKQIGISWATASDTATSAVDFEAATGQLSFAPGETEQTFEVTTVGDYADEPDEQFAINLTSPLNVSVPLAPQAVSIIDDDAACVTADPATSAVNLNSLAGDLGSPQLQQSGTISPCGDSDWYRFTLTEQSDSQKDLQGVITLFSDANDSPANGNINLCARITIGGTSVCSNQSAGTTEVINLCIDDPFGGSDNSTEFYVEVRGSGNAVNNYDLAIAGNTQTGGGQSLSDGC